MADVLLHLVTPEEWEAYRASEQIAPPSLASEGFVHMSSPAQVHLPADRLFAGRIDVQLLVLDPARLPEEVRWEPGVPTDPSSMQFPHHYGPIPVDAVVEVVAYPPGPDGRYGPPVLP